MLSRAKMSTAKVSSFTIKDDGKVRMGMVSPPFPVLRAEPENVADRGKVRLGVMSPLFPPVGPR
jgi:hypothetical protein